MNSNRDSIRVIIVIFIYVSLGGCSNTSIREERRRIHSSIQSELILTNDSTILIAGCSNSNSDISIVEYSLNNFKLKNKCSFSGVAGEIMSGSLSNSGDFCLAVKQKNAFQLLFSKGNKLTHREVEDRKILDILSLDTCYLRISSTNSGNRTITIFDDLDDSPIESFNDFKNIHTQSVGVFQDEIFGLGSLSGHKKNDFSVFHYSLSGEGLFMDGKGLYRDGFIRIIHTKKSNELLSVVRNGGKVELISIDGNIKEKISPGSRIANSSLQDFHIDGDNRVFLLQDLSNSGLGGKRIIVFDGEDWADKKLPMFKSYSFVRNNFVCITHQGDLVKLTW